MSQRSTFDSKRVFASHISLTLGILVYAVLVPVLELNDSHVFNAHWTPHARLHEVWQLLTNSALGSLSLWRLWRHRDTQWPSLISLIVTSAFLLAYALTPGYDGSMRLSDGSEKTLFGINLGLLVFGTIAIHSITVLWRERVRRIIETGAQN